MALGTADGGARRQPAKELLDTCLEDAALGLHVGAELVHPPSDLRFELAES
jgi:hypothetical protein